METPRICPGCQKTLLPDIPLGLCPECLIKSGFSTSTEPGLHGEKTSVPLSVGEVAKLFPQFEILGLLGQGGMGAVYKTRQPGLDRLVALKILPPHASDDPGFAERFNREAKALARLNHPNIVAVYDFGKAAQVQPAPDKPESGHASAAQCYLVMEFVDGMNLREVERAGRLMPAEALKIVPQICDALQFAHNEGIVHRDIKPENILLDKKGRIKITDFGIAKIIGTAPEKIGLTGARDIVGTPHYMAPEQVEHPNSVDHRADIYSLGVVFYELLTGELPIGKFAPPSRKVQVDARLDDVVLRALEKERERRYQQASEVKTDVGLIAGTPPLYPPSIAPLNPSQPPVIKNPVANAIKGPRQGISIGIVVAVVIGMAVLVTALLFMFIVGRHTVAPPVATQRWPASPPNLEKPGSTSGPVPSQPRPVQLSDNEIRDLLIDLKSPAPMPQIAANKLAHAAPGARRDEVESQLLLLLKDPGWPARSAAASALGVWGTDKDDFEPLAVAIDDSNMSVRWAAINALARLKNPKTADVLARHLADNGDLLTTSSALQSLDSSAEDAVIPMLQSKNPEVRYEACRILGKIGTSKSLPALTVAASDSDGIAAMLAKGAISAIDKR